MSGTPGHTELETLVIGVARWRSHREQRTVPRLGLRIRGDALPSGASAAVSPISVVCGWKLSIQNKVLHVGYGRLIGLEYSALQVVAVTLNPVHFQLGCPVQFTLHAQAVLLRVARRQRARIDADNVRLRVLRRLYLCGHRIIPGIPIEVALLGGWVEANVAGLLIGNAAPGVQVQRGKEDAEVAPHDGLVV